MKKLKSKLGKIIVLLITAITILMNVTSYATTIGVQEVEVATQNVKDAVIKLAMPVRICVNVC